MTLVRTTTGQPITCVWDDCTRPGHNEIMVKEQHTDGQWWNYIFCSERHKNLHVNGAKAYGNLAVGSGHGT